MTGVATATLGSVAWRGDGTARMAPAGTPTVTGRRPPSRSGHRAAPPHVRRPWEGRPERVPATAARFRDRLYLVNARFTSPQTPETTFTAVAVPL